LYGVFTENQSIPHFFSKYLPCLAIITFLALSFYSWQQITNGIDPLPALKFTRLIVIPFALTMSATLLTWKYQSTNFFYRFIALLGKHSYLIFLAHTIALRIIYTIVLQKLEMLSLLMVILSWLLMVLLSWRLLNKKLFLVFCFNLAQVQWIKVCWPLWIRPKIKPMQWKHKIPHRSITNHKLKMRKLTKVARKV
jgi:peptidoglycan/LPS O-acetylase OafA/YrhL